jgi:hypothetical protein
MTENFMVGIKRAIREEFAWPGGYPLYLVLGDGEPLCVECGRAEFELLARAHVTKDRSSGWYPIGPDINWEDPSLYCAHCNKRIESAYAEPEEEPSL